MKTKMASVRNLPVGWNYFSGVLLICLATLASCSPVIGSGNSEATATKSVSLTTNEIYQKSTLTPLPTLPSSLIGEHLIDMLDITPNCQLPCLLSITPGETSPAEASQFFDRFSLVTLRSYQEDSGNAFYQMQFEDPGLLLTIYFESVDGTISNMFVATEMREKVEGGFERVYGDPEYLDLMDPFTLANILGTLGEPEDIYVKFFNLSPGRFPAHIVLDYSDHGFVVEYVSEIYYKQEAEGFIAYTCPISSFITLRSFDTAIDLSLADLFDKFDNFSLYESLEGVTNMTVNEFASVYVSDECLDFVETNAAMWPSEFDITP